MNTVSLQKVESYEPRIVREGLVRLVEAFGGMGAFVSPGERVLLKPNMLLAKPPEKAVTTHPEVLRGVIELVKEAGGVPLVGDSPGVGSARRVAEKSGMFRVIEETGAELVEFSESTEVAGNGMFKRFEIARPYMQADRLINIAKLKTHEMMTITCSVKNLFGSIIGTSKAAWHLKAGAERELFARLLLEIYLLRKPDLNIVDAIIAMEGNGPGSGDQRHVGLIMGGTNPVAIDVIAAEIIGIPRKLLHVERMAKKLKIEGSERHLIRTIGADLEDVKIKSFRLPHISDVQFGLPSFLKKRLKQLMTSRPFAVSGKCKLCGICVDACPPKAMAIRNDRLTIDYHSCIRCFCCRELCPDGALDVVDGMLLKFLRKYV